MLKLLKKVARRFIDRDESFNKKLRRLGAIVGNNVQIVDRGSLLFEPWVAYLIEIHDNVIVAAGVRFVNHDSSYSNLFDDLPVKYGKIIIGENTYIGVNCVILPGVEIGRNSLIGAGTLVNKSIPENSIAVGNPVRVIGNVEEGKEKYLKSIENARDPLVDFIDLGGSFSQMKNRYGNATTDHIVNTVNNHFKNRK